jgi:AraC family transcriptional regulator
MKHRIEQKPALEAVGYTFRTTTVGGANMTEIPKFWGRCDAEGKVRRLEPLAGSFGILGLCADFDDKMERFTYVIGVEAEPGMHIPDGAEEVKVPAATYAVFSCVGAMPYAIHAGWNEIMGEWFPSSEYVQANPVNFELYPAFPEGDERGDPASPKCYTEIWIPIKQK